MPTYTSAQEQVAGAPAAKIFLEGPFGTGKTTAGALRLARLLERGERPTTILVLLPSRALGGPYYAVQGAAPGEEVAPVLTLAGLARRMVERFWETAAGPAGFARLQEPPVFLNHETAQYHMGRVAAPLLEQGLFESLTIERSRLYSQLLTDLNLAAAAGLAHTGIGARLALAQEGSPAGRRIAADAQAAAENFRRYCLEHNLVDFSLLIDLWREQIWPVPAHRNYLLRSVRHLIADELEENIPIAHDLLSELLPGLRSALLIYNQGGGLRTLLGADPVSAYRLKGLCAEQLQWEQSYVMSEAVQQAEAQLQGAFDGFSPSPLVGEGGRGMGGSILYASHRYYPQMLDWVADQAAYLVRERGVPPEEIAILAPALSDALRFALSERLGQRGVAAQSLRPSRPLQDEPSARALLALAAYALPEWGLPVNGYDLVYALVQVIAGLDLVRGQMLVQQAAGEPGTIEGLAPFDSLPEKAAGRITPELGERYERLRSWLETQAAGAAPAAAPEGFFLRLYEEVLAQPGFGFHANPKAAQTVANLADSLRGFVTSAGEMLAAQGITPAGEWAQAVQDGLLSAQYLRNWMDIDSLTGSEGEAGAEDAPAPAVLLAAAHTFALSGRAATVQFWLSIGSYRWAGRPYQPLTHPALLSREWPDGRPWTDQDEILADRQALARLVTGLARRCRDRIYLAASELSDSGMEERGLLGRLLQGTLETDRI